MDWRTIIGLARDGGLRVPSELTRWGWRDVDYEAGQLIIRATKTEHHAGKGRRVCPLFPELRRLLKQARSSPGADQEFVIRDPNLRAADVNLRTGMERIIARAGHQQWPSLFQNLRKSRVTELLEEGRSPQSIATLLGHSIQVMMKHYLIATDRDFQAALEEPGRGAWSAEGTKLW